MGNAFGIDALGSGSFLQFSVLFLTATTALGLQIVRKGGKISREPIVPAIARALDAYLADDH